MSQNSSASIERFRLSNVTVRDDGGSVYRWIGVAARRNVKEIDLTIDSQTPFDLPFSNEKTNIIWLKGFEGTEGTVQKMMQFQRSSSTLAFKFLHPTSETNIFNI